MGFKMDGANLYRQMIAEKQAEREAKKAAGKRPKGERPEDPRYSGELLGRMAANSWVSKGDDGQYLVKVATSGPRRGRAPAAYCGATPEDVAEFCEALKAFAGDKELLETRYQECQAFLAERAKK